MTSIPAQGLRNELIKRIGDRAVQVPFSREQVSKMLALLTKEARCMRNSGNLTEIIAYEELCQNLMAAQLLLGSG